MFLSSTSEKSFMTRFVRSSSESREEKNHVLMQSIIPIQHNRIQKLYSLKEGFTVVYHHFESGTNMANYSTHLNLMLNISGNIKFL